jgi:endonuclease III-like uncharacterized protein
MKNLPISLQSFATVRDKNEDFVYIDKTEYIYKIVRQQGTYFLSRPRRFGKSLLVSAMRALFEGKKELFEGLWIYDKWDWEKTNPVIHLDMSALDSENAATFGISTVEYLRLTAEEKGLSLVSSTASGCLGELIKKLSMQTGKKVVLLIDEYDTPILDALGEAQLEDIKTFLRTFYRQLKANAENIRMIFITGITKFAKLSLFSTLNNPKDLTMEKEFAAICGLTQQELEDYFPDRIDELARQFNWTREMALANIKKQYDGYSWDGVTHVYNPVSTMSLLDRYLFENYWFETGTPAFLIKQLAVNDEFNLVSEAVVATKFVVETFTPESINNIALMFQSGYLTIKEVILKEMEQSFILAVPNKEVNDSMAFALLIAMSNCRQDEISQIVHRLKESLHSCNEQVFNDGMRSLLANIPYSLHIGKEKYYHSLFLAWMTTMGFRTNSEVETNIGRIDAVLEASDLTVITELKYSAEKSSTTLLKAAMKQIHDRRYYEKYIGVSGKPVLLLALAYSGAEKAMVCKMDMVKS